MEGDQKFRYVCKVCNKRCPSGKSLGGHMRSHAIANSAQSKGKKECKIESGFEFGEQSGYGLRENPKKSWRAVGCSGLPLQEEKVCKQCGKGFQSLKALCGHMACHSEKERAVNEDCSWSIENQKLVVVESCSDSEPNGLRQRRKRPASKRLIKRSVVKCSSSVSDVEQEQEELAMCLLMLSRDCGKRGGANSVMESSDNNSVVLETKSSSTDMSIGKKGGLNSDDEHVRFENSDFGCFRNVAKKVESDLSVDGFSRHGEYRKHKVDGGSRIEGYGVDLGKKGSKRLKCREAEVSEERKGLNNEKGYDKAGIAPNSVKFDSTKSFNNGSSSVRVCKNDPKRSKFKPCRGKDRTSQVLSSNAEKNSKVKKSKGHVCPICLKVFKSGQALGGHKRFHIIGGSEDRSDRTLVIKQELPKASDLIDLNLPAPMEDEVDELSQFLP